jgi:hypothetical protein
MRAVAITLLLFLIGSAEVAAQSRCGPRQAILEIAWRQYQERPVAIALATGGAVLEVLATRAGKTFTMLHTGANGISCILATGESWQAVEWSAPHREKPGS